MPGSVGESFSIAQGVVRQAEAIVTDRITQTSAFATSAFNSATSVINLLAGTKFTITSEPPAPTALDLTISGELKLDKVLPNAFGMIEGPQNIAVPAVPNVTIGTVAIPDFVPSITGLIIPEAPGALDTSGLPTHPAVGTVTIPTQPSLITPTMDSLTDVSVPAFTFPTLPTFDSTAPVFEPTALHSVLYWTEPTYQQEILDEAIVQVRRYFAGGTGLPPAVEQALFARSNDREDQLVEREVGQAYDEFAVRGYTLPPGVLSAKTDMVRQDSLLRKQGAQREVTIKAAEWEIQNLRFAVEQGIACENVLVNIFLNQAERMFQGAKFQIEANIQVYNAQITLFNARQQAYSTAAQVFKIKTDAALAVLEVFKAQIQGEIAKSQLNESKVRVFLAKVQSLQVQIELYKTNMEAARIQSDVIRTQIEAFKSDVEAYAAKVQAGKLVFDAYTARVGGEVAKAQILDAEARAYASLISGKTAIADINIKTAQVNLEKYREQILQYNARLEVEKVRMQYQLSAIQAAVAAFTADTQRFSAQVDAEKAKVQLSITGKETEIRSNLAYFDALVKSYDIRMQKLIEEGRLNVQGLTAAGQVSATLAAGALAAVHVGAQITGSGGINAQGQSSDGFSQTNSTQYSELHTFREK